MSIYKGLWMPVITIVPFLEPASFNLSRIKDDGINTISFELVHKAEKNGSVSIYTLSRALTVFQIKRMQRAGFQVMLTNEVMEKLDPRFQTLSSEVIDSPKFWANWNQEVIKSAKLAEKYGVELYSPLNEPEVKFAAEPDRAWQWAQEILPQIKKVYHGKIVWKGSFSSEFEDPKYDFKKANFSGYDYLGFSTSLCDTLENYQNRVKRLIAFLKPIADASQTKLMVTEFGAWDKPWNENPENVRQGYEIVLEEGYRNNLEGYFALEGPIGQPQLSDFESVIIKWYKEELP